MDEEEHEDSITKFPGLFTDVPNKQGVSESDYSASEKTIKKDILKKEKKKDISYSTLDGESSAEEMDLFDSKSSGKCKKTKSFKFLQKKDKDEKDDKKRKDEKDAKNKEKRKEKEFRKREKEEKRKSKKDKKKKFLQYDEEDFPIFGVPLSLAVERCPSHDGIRLPAIVRQCIDFIEEKGLSCEGIYRTGGVKSKVQSIRRACNSGEVIQLEEQHPHVVASLLKQYLRELPETVLTVDMMPHFEDVSLIPNPKERAEAMRQLIDRLPTTNRLLLQYMLKHMGNVIEKEFENKMSYQNVCVVLSPTIQISHRVLNVMFHSHQYLFGNVVIKKYVPPITSCSADLRSIEELKSPKLIEEELNKQDSLLASLHAAVASGRVSRFTEEQLWEAQRNHTLLKRRLKMYDRRDSVSNGGSESSQEKLNIHPESHGDAQDSSCEEKEVADAVVVKVAKEVSHNEQKDTHTPIHIATTIALKSSKGKTTDDINSEHLSTHEKKKKTSIEKSDSENSESGINRVTISASTVKDLSIPVLPKPLSVRNTRNKIVQEEKEFSSPQRDSLSFTKGYEPLVKQDGGLSSTKIDVTVALPLENVSIIPARSSLPHDRPIVNSSPTSSSNLQTIMPKNVESNKIVLNISNSNVPSNTERQPKKLYHTITHLKDPDSIIIMKEELRLQFEHEERLAMNQELTKKLKAEKSEISRLREEIQEMQTIYGYRTHSYDSSESDGTDSEGESDSEEDILTQISTLDIMNEKIQIENISLLKKIEEEREAVIHLRVALREAKFQQAQQRSQQVTYAVVAS